MNHRRVIAVASMISALVALYLHLWKLGYAGSLVCGIEERGCEYIQTSRYGWFLGYDVALIGTVGYTMLTLTATITSFGRLANSRWGTIALMVHIWPAVVFTIRLKYGEFVVLRGFCPWCMVSALTITLCAILVTLDWRRVRRVASEG